MSVRSDDRDRRSRDVEVEMLPQDETRMMTNSVVDYFQ